MKQRDKSETASQLIAERLVGIDVLRGIAVLFVVFNHIPHYAMGGFRENPFFFPAMAMDYGYLGVPLFVLISGFCIHRRASIAEMKIGTAELDWLDFWKRRFWRLYPPYVAAMIFSVTASILVYAKSPVVMETLFWDTVAHMLMVHNLTANYAAGMSNGAFWSLGMEEQLYLLYVPLFFLFRRNRRSTALFLAAATTVAWRSISLAACAIDLDPVMPDRFYGLGAWGLWPFSFWLHWTLGAISVDAYFGNCCLPKWCSSLTVAMIIAGVATVTNRIFLEFLSHTSLASAFVTFTMLGQRFSNLSELAFAVAFFCLLNWCVTAGSRHPLLSNRGSGLMAKLGKISYSVYLVHIPVIYSLGVILPFKHSLPEWMARMLIYTGVSLFVSVVFYSLVERRFIQGRCPWGRREVVVVPRPAVNVQGSSTSPDRVI